MQSKKGVYCTEKHTAEKGDGVGREVASLDLVVREGLSETIRSDLKLERERWVSGDFGVPRNFQEARVAMRGGRGKQWERRWCGRGPSATSSPSFF